MEAEDWPSLDHLGEPSAKAHLNVLQHTRRQNGRNNCLNFIKTIWDFEKAVAWNKNVIELEAFTHEEGYELLF